MTRRAIVATAGVLLLAACVWAQEPEQLIQSDAVRIVVGSDVDFVSGPVVLEAAPPGAARPAIMPARGDRLMVVGEPRAVDVASGVRDPQAEEAAKTAINRIKQLGSKQNADLAIRTLEQIARESANPAIRRSALFAISDMQVKKGDVQAAIETLARVCMMPSAGPVVGYRPVGEMPGAPLRVGPVPDRPWSQQLRQEWERHQRMGMNVPPVPGLPRRRPGEPGGYSPPPVAPLYQQPQYQNPYMQPPPQPSAPYQPLPPQGLYPPQPGQGYYPPPQPPQGHYPQQGQSGWNPQPPQGYYPPQPPPYLPSSPQGWVPPVPGPYGVPAPGGQPPVDRDQIRVNVPVSPFPPDVHLREPEMMPQFLDQPPRRPSGLEPGGPREQWQRVPSSGPASRPAVTGEPTGPGRGRG